jgi:hypothetical protein
VQNLVDYREEGDSRDVLLEQCPSGSRDRAVAALELARAALLPDAHPCDESLPKDLAPLITEHEVTTVRAAGWSSVKNGRRLNLAAAGFDVFLTADRNLEYQQNLSTLPMAVVVLFVRRTRLRAIEPLVPELLKVLNHLPPKVLEGWRLANQV